MKYALGWKEVQARKVKKGVFSMLKSLFNKKTSLIVVRNVQRKKIAALQVSY